MVHCLKESLQILNRMKTNPYQSIQFLKSASKMNQLPQDSGYEVAFAGRSNAGKSSALNTLTGIKQLARTSKTPGRTQLINVFAMPDEKYRVIDLPGYGYAKVSKSVKKDWQEHLSEYLKQRQCLKGLFLLMDVRHPLKELDRAMIDWSIVNQLPIHVLLTKSDKLSRNQALKSLQLVKNHYKTYPHLTIQLFSSQTKQGLAELIEKLNEWFGELSC